MKKSLFIFSLLFVFVSSLYSQESQSGLEIPALLKQGQSGKYDLKSPHAGFYHPQNLRGMLYLPQSLKGKDLSGKALIVFFHGASSNVNAYKNTVGDLIKWSEKYGFLLLSLQNTWALDFKRDATRAMMDNNEAAAEMIQGLAEAQLIDKTKVFATGFSAGGFAALCAGLYRPDLFSGVGDFKGNFYPDVAESLIYASKELLEFLKVPQEKRNLKNLKVFISLGGSKEAERVKQQVPLAVEYLEKFLSIRAVLKNYPQEGHTLNEGNFKDFWNAMN